MKNSLFSLSGISLVALSAVAMNACMPTPEGQSIVDPQDFAARPPIAMTSTASATVVGGRFAAGSLSRAPRIVVAYNDFQDTLTSAGVQRAGSSMMGVAVSDDHGVTWNRQVIPLPPPFGALRLDGIGGNPAIASAGWMQPVVGGQAPAQSAVVHVAEAFTLQLVNPNDPTMGTFRSAKVVCSASNDGAMTWSQPLNVPPMFNIGNLVTPSRPAITVHSISGQQIAYLAMIGDEGTPNATVRVTHAPIGANNNGCTFSGSYYAPFLPSGDAERLRRVKIVSNPRLGALLAMELRSPIAGASGDENNELCTVHLEQLTLVPSPSGAQIQGRALPSFEGPCRRLVRVGGVDLDLSHMDFALDASTTVAIAGAPRVDTTARRAHLVMTRDPSAEDTIEGSEVVYQELVSDLAGITQTFTAATPVVLSDAVSAGEIVFQPTVSSVELPAQAGQSASSHVFVTWYQMNGNGQVRFFGRTRPAGSSQWSPARLLHSNDLQSTESICPTARELDPLWSQYGSSISLMDGWPGGASLSDPNLRLDYFPLTVTFFTSSRQQPCSDRAFDAALFQELHAARWR